MLKICRLLVYFLLCRKKRRQCLKAAKAKKRWRVSPAGDITRVATTREAGKQNMLAGTGSVRKAAAAYRQNREQYGKQESAAGRWPGKAQKNAVAAAYDNAFPLAGRRRQKIILTKERQQNLWKRAGPPLCRGKKKRGWRRTITAAVYRRGGEYRRIRRRRSSM